MDTLGVNESKESFELPKKKNVERKQKVFSREVFKFQTGN